MYRLCAFHYRHSFIEKEGICLSKIITYQTWNEPKALQIERNFHDAEDVLQWAYKHYNEQQITYACSFGAEGIVLIDLISKINRNATIMFLDTNLHFQETYELIEHVKQRYPTLQIKIVEPKLTLEEQRDTYGDRLWERDPNQCCTIRKIEPLSLNLSDKTAWISGLRREQSVERSEVNYLNKDHKFTAIKICPLIHWTWKDVWKYIIQHDLDYNILHDKGYPSLGCEKCTLPATNTDDSRSGRWAHFNKTECGLH